MPPNPRLVLRSVKPHSKPVEPVDLLDDGGAKPRRHRVTDVNNDETVIHPRDHFAHNSTGPYPISNMEPLKTKPATQTMHSQLNSRHFRSDSNLYWN